MARIQGCALTLVTFKTKIDDPRIHQRAFILVTFETNPKMDLKSWTYQMAISSSYFPTSILVTNTPIVLGKALTWRCLGSSHSSFYTSFKIKKPLISRFLPQIIKFSMQSTKSSKQLVRKSHGRTCFAIVFSHFVYWRALNARERLWTI